MVRHWINFGGVSTTCYDCYCDGSESFTAPERDVEAVTILGRNGDLLLDKGRWKNQDIKYTLFFNKREEFEEYKNRLLSKPGIQRLEDSHHMGEYRLASINGAIEPKVAGFDNEYCSLELTFNAKPQRFLTSGEEKISASVRTINNPTNYDALPLITISGNGSNSGSIYINGVEIVVATQSAYPNMYIDCESQNAYYNSSIDANSDIVLSNDVFFTLKPGNNTITSGLSGNVYITPRWWRV